MTELVESVLLNALPDGVILIEGDQVAYANPAASQLLGAALPATVTRLLPVTLIGLVGEARRGRPAMEVIERGNPRRWIEVAAKPLGADQSSVVLVLRDVTEVRKVEAMRRDFVADASHELKTPVASIRAAAETLLRAMDEDPVAARRFAGQLHVTAGRLSHIVSDLLDLSRVESEQPELKTVDLALLVAKEADRIGDRAEVRGVDVVTDVEPAPVDASRKDLRLAVRNLLDNAVEYTPAGGKVTISTRDRAEEVRMTVVDTGMGIPGRDIPRIFERFYRVDDARNRETGGTGLGLAIVRHVVEMHGGTVTVESELGAGTAFTVSLPRAGTDG